MTCIIAYIDELGNAHMVGDSGGTNVSQHSRTDLSTSKIFKKGDMLVGFTTSFRMGQLLQYCLKLPERKEDLSDYEYLITQFVPALFEMYENGKYAKDPEKKGGNFLIAWNGEIYEVTAEYSVLWMDSMFGSVGSGYNYALPVMDMMSKMELFDIDDIEKQLKSVLNTVSKYNITVSGRTDYINDRDTETE